MSEEHKQIGKIRAVNFGAGGYQGAMFGISFDLGSSGWGVCDFWGAWGAGIEWTKHCKWTEEDRIRSHGETSLRISKLMEEAKVDSVMDLKDLPVEVTFHEAFGRLKSWRLLKEVM